jgi:enamine deaminase RidA (YjgF/YER057c/UK114 family)
MSADAEPGSITYLDQNHRRSRAIRHDSTIYLAGQVADDLSGGIEVQTRQVLAKIDALLEEAGSSRGRILSATIWMKDMADLGAFNALWDAWVVPDRRPTRACSAVKLTDPRFLLEIIVVAATRGGL